MAIFRRRGFFRRRAMRFNPFRRRRFGFRRRSNLVKVHRPEVKKFDIVATDAQMEAAGNITLLSDIDQGITVGTRIGNRVWAKYVAARLIATNRVAAGGTGSDVALRFIIFQDTRGSQDTPSVTEVLQTTAVNSQLSATFSGRFRILWDKTFAISPTWNQLSLVSGTGDTEGEINTRVYKMYRKLYGRAQSLTWSSATGTDVDLNGLYLLALTNEDQTGAYEMRVRIGFTDQ